VNIKLKQFEGPLDLLLQLIQKQKLDISSISLAQVTDQYINYLKSRSDVNFDILMSFVDIASRLIAIKTRLLLPYLESDDNEEDEIDLISQLKDYEKYLDISKQLLGLWYESATNLYRVKSSQKKVLFTSESILKNLNTKILHKAYCRMHRRSQISTKETTRFKKLLKIKDKIAYISKYLEQQNQFAMSDLITSKASRSEVIVSFLALLELVKVQTVLIKQSDMFGKIEISHNM